MSDVAAPGGTPRRVSRIGTRARALPIPSTVATVLLSLLLALLIAYPIGMLLYGVFSKEPPQNLEFSLGNLTLENVEGIATSAAMHKAILISFAGAAGGTAMSLAIAMFFAWTVARVEVRYKRLIELAALLPLLISPLVAGIAWAKLALPHSGVLNMGLRELGIAITLDIGSLGGIIFVMGLYYAPYAYLLIVGSLRNIDPALEEAATICGASPRYAIWRITLPLISHAIFSAALLVMVTLLALYSIPFLLGESNGVYFMTTYLWRLILQTPPDYQAAATVGLFLTIITVAAVMIQRRALGRRRFTTITGRAYRPRLIEAGRWRYVLLGAAAVYIVVAAIVPYLALGLATFRENQFYSNFSDIFALDALSLANLKEVIERPELLRSVTNSLVVGVSTAVLGVVLCFVLAYVTERTKWRGRSMLRAVATVPVAIPGLILGVAFLWAWIVLPIGLYGTIWILVAAFLARHIPDGLRAISATMVQVHEELEEGARICGASWARTMRSIVIPLVRSGVLSAAILLFIFSIREIGPALFLYNPKTTIMSVQIVTSWEVGDVATAATVALLQSVILLVVVGLARWLWRVDITPS
jgi:iron(III) transport system permease protein